MRGTALNVNGLQFISGEMAIRAEMNLESRELFSGARQTSAPSSSFVVAAATFNFRDVSGRKLFDPLWLRATKVQPVRARRFMCGGPISDSKF